MKEKRKNRRLSVKLNRKDRAGITEILSGGVESVRTIKRVQILKLLHEGLSSNQAAAAIGVSPETARRIGWNYNRSGLQRALYDLPRPGNAPLLNKKQEIRIIAMTCAKPPDGVAQWSTALIAREAIRRRIIPAVSRETIRILLKRHDLKPWREKNVVYTGRAGSRIY